MAKARYFRVIRWDDHVTQAAVLVAAARSELVRADHAATTDEGKRRINRLRVMLRDTEQAFAFEER